MSTRGLVLSLSLLFTASMLAVNARADVTFAQVSGNWLTEAKDGIFQITVKPDGSMEGRLVGGSYPGRKDAKNPNPARRALPLRGQVILREMKYDGAGHWSGGTIYDPDKGSTYKCLVERLANGTLKLRGYIGFSLLGRTQIWTRYTGTSMDLPRPH